jgi:hypothetical protein
MLRLPLLCGRWPAARRRRAWRADPKDELAGSMGEIDQQLAELREMATVSEVSALVHEFVAGRLAEEPEHGARLRGVFRMHLWRELRFHRSLGNFLVSGDVTYGSVVSLADKRRVSLRETLEALGDGAGDSGAGQALGWLLRAECQRGLGDLEASSEALRKALAAGVDDPVVHFALGSDLFGLAQETRAGEGLSEGEGEERVREGWPYREALLAAVSAYEAGLSGGPLDARLYHAMSVCLEYAGFASAAEDARRQAEKLGGEGAPAEAAGTPLAHIEPSDLARYLRGSFVAADIVQGADEAPPR